VAYPDNDFDEDDEDDEDAAELDARDAPDPSDTGEDDGPAEIPCPYCRKEMSELAEVCPHCGSYISSEDAPRRRPWWLLAGVAVTMAAVLLAWVLRG
jgi:hypothetical protein